MSQYVYINDIYYCVNNNDCVIIAYRHFSLLRLRTFYLPKHSATLSLFTIMNICKITYFKKLLLIFDSIIRLV